MTTPTYGGASAIATSTSSVVLTPISGSIASLPVGSVVLFLAWRKDFTGTDAIVCTTPDNGLTFLGEVASPTGIGGGDAGPVRISGFVREVDGTELGSYAFGAAGNVAQGQAFLVTKGAGSGAWDIAMAGGLDVTGGNPWSVTTSPIDLKAEDLVIVGSVTPADTYSGGPTAGAIFSAEAVTEDSLTFGAATEISEPNTSSGQDLGAFMFRAAVTAGADATATPTVTATVTGDSLAREYGATMLVRFRLVPVAPGIPTAVVATPDTYTAVLDWAVPATGGAPDGYRVRVDGGGSTDVGNVLTHEFTGLDPETAYTLSVQAYNAGGSSAWVDVVTETQIAPPPGWYRLVLTAGPYSWTVERGDADSYGPVLPLSLGWDMPDAEEFYPSPVNPSTMSLRLLAADASDLEDLEEGATVTMRMWVDPDPGAAAWQSFAGIVTGLSGETVTGADDPDTLDFLVTLYAADDTMRLADLWVGWTVDWPLESQADRFDRICTEAGLDSDVLFGSPMEGWMPARTARPTTVLQALREVLRDTAHEDDSTMGGPFYGVYNLHYTPPYVDEAAVPWPGLVELYPLDRRVYPAQANVLSLDGAHTFAAGSWSKLRGRRAGTWGLVDGVTVGTPDDTVPFVRTTSLVDYFGDPPGSELNGTATMRDRIGEALLATTSTQLAGWHTRLLRYDTVEDPDPMGPQSWSPVGIPSLSPLPTSVSVVATPLRPELRLVEGADYIAGTLVGARLVIPAGGDHYVELRLRAELLDGVTLP